MRLIDAMWICGTRPVCHCSGEDGTDPLDGFSCDCAPESRDVANTRCLNCDAPLRALDPETDQPMESLQ